MIRVDYDDVIYSTRKGKLNAIVEDIVERSATGQPMLIGTITVEKSEELSKMLSLRKVKHNVLNAKNHEREAEIVAQAGRFGAVTIATNMAGRGTDILLGGNPEYLAKEEMKRKGYSDERIEKATSYADGDEETAQLKAVYREIYDRYKAQTEEEKQKVIALGGLHIIGTERHDSRRIDNQLRGRSGRQGDPGSSVFFISLEDDMARIFGGERLQGAFRFLRVDENTPISAKMITKQIERAQKNIESQNFAARKYVLQYDDVMNLQRNIIYAERMKVLQGEDVHEDIRKMIPSVVQDTLSRLSDVTAPVKDWDVDEVNRVLYESLTENEVTFDEDWKSLDYAGVCERLTELSEQALDRRLKEFEGELDFREAERYVLLKTVDERWIEHIDAMEQLRKGIGLRAIGNHDPVMTYKNEGFEMFEATIQDIKNTTVKICLKATIRKVPERQRRAEEQKRPMQPQGISRNAPCPCGSGKKYKHCCGKNK